MDIVTLITSFEFKTIGLFLLFTSSSASIFFVIHAFLADIHHRHKIAFIGTSIMLWTLAGVSGWRMAIQLLAVPAIEKTAPTASGALSTQTPTVTYTFSSPVDLSVISVNTYPQMDLDIKPAGYMGNRVSIGRTLTISSKTTLPPGENYMVYLSNIEGPYTRGYGGEYQLDLHTAPVDVTEVTPSDSQSPVAVDQTFTIKLNQPLVSENEWTVSSSPQHIFTVRKNDEQSIAITPQTPMKQATQYVLSVIHTPTTRALAGGEKVQTFSPAVKKILRVTTVRPPILATIEPQGMGVDPAAPLRIFFDQPMDRASVTANVHISPAIVVTPQWDMLGKELTLTHAVLPKDTDFVLSLKKGVKTISGGVTESDLIYQFRTAGHVSIAQSVPNDKTTDIPVAEPITLTFDQQVPSTIVDYVKITPPITATSSALGRTLTYFPSIPLLYETQYSVSLKVGAPTVVGLPSSKNQTFSFTTTPQTLAVPYYKQQSAFTCNIASARMLLAFRGVNVTEQNLIDVIGIGGKRGSGNPHKGYVDDYGTYWDPVSRGVNTYRPTRLITSGKLADIITEIKKGNPVMTWGQNGWSDPHDISWTAKDGTFIKAINGMHSAVVRGYTGSDANPTLILLNDPWRGRYSITAKEFMRRWGYLGIAMVVE